jgi:anaerobic selenocysteine-containing dehydrogenase
MTVPVFCGKDCGGNACPMLAEVEEGQVRRIRPNPAAGPWILPCQRGLTLAEHFRSPLRLLAPLVRKAPRASREGDPGLDAFREASWDEALALVAARLGEVAAKHGSDSILNLSSAGSTGALHSTQDLAQRFLMATGGCTSLTGSYSTGAARFVLPYLLGPGWKDSGFDPATMRHAGTIVLWGANILEARLGSELPARLLEARRRGACIIVIDPRRTVTVERAATWHLPCRPGTDAALMLAVLHVLLEEGLAKRDWAEERSTGFARLADRVLGLEDGLVRGPEWAERMCGVPAEDIRRLARAWVEAGPTMLLPGYSIQRVHGGEEPYRLAVALQLATGNFGAPGGSTGSLNNRLPAPRVGSIPTLTRPGSPDLPVLLWPDAILGGRVAGFPTDLRAALVAGGNWLGQGADAYKSARALDALDFSVCLELFPTPTALRCDVILPVASPLEKADIGIPWLGNWLSYKTRAEAPAGQARTDYDVYAELSERLGHGEVFTEGRNEQAWLDKFLSDSEIGDVEAFKASGFYLAPDQERVGLAAFAADPKGHPLGTPSGLVELASGAWARDTGADGLPDYRGRPTLPDLPLLLVSPKVGHRTHSQGGDAVRVAATGGHFLDMHPADAAARGIVNGDEVHIRGETASVSARSRLSDSLMRGVVSLPEGTWLPTDTSDYGTSGSPNLLTATSDHGPARAVSMHGIRIEVSLARPPGDSCDPGPGR